MEPITIRIPEELHTLVEAMADHHEITKSKAGRILIEEGVYNQDIRYRTERVDAKMDVLLESLGVEDHATEQIEKRFRAINEDGLTPRGTGDSIRHYPYIFNERSADPTQDTRVSDISDDAE